MVVSTNPEPIGKAFQLLLDSTIKTLEQASKRNQKEYLGYLGNKLEHVIADVMTDQAVGTPFENSIELISGQRFPDIIANKFYGVEVKTTTQNHWTTTGNSVLEGTRVDGIERIFMLFGKMVSPVEFKCRPYEQCLSEVVVTHSPRYLIDMDLSNGQTIFDKLSIPYDELRKYPNPVKPIIDYYRQFLKPGDQVWWMDQDEPKSTSVIIQLWKNLSTKHRNELTAMAMVLFPEIFGKRQDKFSRVSVWLVNEKGVVCPNIRDEFTGGGQGSVVWGRKQFHRIPRIIVNMIDSLPEIKRTLEAIEKVAVKEFWGIPVKDKYEAWVSLVWNNAKSLNLPFDIKQFLSESH